MPGSPFDGGSVTTSMYQMSLPRFVHMLRNLSAILDKAQAYSDAKKLDPAVLPSARLYPDMLPLSAQVRIACDTANGFASRLSGVAAPTFDEDRTIADLKARVERSIAYLGSIAAGQIDGTEDKETVVKVAGKDVTYKGRQYLLARAIPNFHFHVATAYGILRHNGLEIGKSDYLGNTRSG